MALDLTPDELLTTTRAVRRRLDLNRPVERSVIEECLGIALQAPSGSNMQRWQWLFVEDADKKLALAELYRATFAVVYTPEIGAAMDPGRQRVWSSAGYLAEHFHEVPVIMIPCQKGRPDDGNQASYWGSLLPAVWSFHLALRSRGLGSAWTTMALQHEKEIADIVGIPYDDYAQAGMFPIAYTLGTDFKPAPRKGVDDVIHWNSW
jgi:nitroreductase